MLLATDLMRARARVCFGMHALDLHEEKEAVRKERNGKRVPPRPGRQNQLKKATNRTKQQTTHPRNTKYIHSTKIVHSHNQDFRSTRYYIE